MARFRIFYFQDSVLDHAEQVERPDVLEAVRRASRKSPELKAEVWSDKGKVGIIGRARCGLGRARLATKGRLSAR